MVTTKSVVLFALVYGIAFALAGLGGFVPGLNQMHGDHSGLAVEGPGHGYLLGLFHVNVLHNLIHLAFGIWGLIAWRGGFGASRTYGRGVAVIYGLFTVMGLIPVLNTVFGLVPIHGNDVWLHALLAIVAAVFGFSRVNDSPTSTTADTTTTPAM
ncbi:DUF4383 domain-containing protein [bacterium]|nr:MAG: DUF4383 domain-containing protein [bacterium]